LTEAFFGDALAAEYVLFNLISKIYVRRDRLCLGKLSLNLFNLPRGENVDKARVFLPDSNIQSNVI
jgi:hypothetical protein